MRQGIVDASLDQFSAACDEVFHQCVNPRENLLSPGFIHRYRITVLAGGRPGEPEFDIWAALDDDGWLVISSCSDAQREVTLHDESDLSEALHKLAHEISLRTLGADSRFLCTMTSPSP